MIAALAMLPMGSASAGDWQGLSIGQAGLGSEMAFADAFHITGALARGGGRDVILLRDMDPATVLASLSGWPEGIGAILYVATSARDGALDLRDQTLSLDAMVQALASRKVTDIVLLLENCTAQDGTPASFALPEFAPDLRVLVAQSTGSGTACPDSGNRLTDLIRIASADASLQSVLTDKIVQDSLTAPVPVAERIQSGASPLTPVAPQVGDVITAGPDFLVPNKVETPRVQAVEAISPTLDLGGGSVLVFAAAPASQLLAVPRAAGLPEPSIIVGVIQISATSSFAPVQQLDDVSRSEIAYDNLPARLALRSQDPTLFASLVEAGAFDPPAPLVPSALQQELARMNCYRGRIDGDWGGGSRGALTRYFGERPGVAAVTEQPLAILFRQIIVVDDVQCPAQTVSAPRPTRTTSTRNTGEQPSSGATTSTRAAPVPSVQPSVGRTLSLGRRINTR